MPVYAYFLFAVVAGLAIYAILKKRFISAALWLVIGVFAFLVTESIMKPIRFTEVRDSRYEQVIKKLDVIGDAQKLYRSSKGNFAPNFDELYRFLDSDVVYLTQTRVEKVKEYNSALRIDIEKDVKIVDTVAIVNAREQLRTTSEKFKAYEDLNGGDYKKLRLVPTFYRNQAPADFSMAASSIERGQNTVPTFEAKVDKAYILADQNEDLVNAELEAVVGVRGSELKIGDLLSPTTEGNWGKIE